MIKIESYNILYLEAMSNYTIVHTLHDKRLVRSKTLKFIQNEIEQEHFIRVHSKYLINASFIKEISKNHGCVHMTNGKVIPVARRRRLQLKEILTLGLNFA